MACQIWDTLYATLYLSISWQDVYLRNLNRYIYSILFLCRYYIYVTKSLTDVSRLAIVHRYFLEFLGILSPIINRGSTNFTSYGCNYQAYSYILLYRDPRSVRFQRVRATQSDLFKRAVRALRNIPLSDTAILNICPVSLYVRRHIHAYIRACVRTHVPARRYVFLSRAQEKVHRSEEKRTIVSRSGVENRVTREE